MKEKFNNLKAYLSLTKILVYLENKVIKLLEV